MSENKPSTSYSYEQAGVSIAAGNALVKAIAPLAKATARPGADAELGGFGGSVAGHVVCSLAVRKARHSMLAGRRWLAADRPAAARRSSPVT